MSLPVETFNAGFQKLCDAFGKSYSKGSARVYFEQLEDVFDGPSWGRIVNWWINSKPTFPKISELIPMGDARQAASEHDVARAFIEDDCAVMECRGGVIPVQDGLYEVAWRCPCCDRSGIPSMPRYAGAVHRFTAEEMAERRRERVRIVNSANVAPMAKAVGA